MNPNAILNELTERMVTIWPAEDRLCLRPAENVPPELVAEIRQHKGELLSILSLEGWPPECQEAVRTFRHAHARLFPLLGKRVQTPRGPGQLIDAKRPHAGVVLDQDPGRATYFFWDEIKPLSRPVEPVGAAEPPG